MDVCVVCVLITFKYNLTPFIIKFYLSICISLSVCHQLINFLKLCNSCISFLIYSLFTF